MIDVFRYSIFDPEKDEYIRSTRMATAPLIFKLGGKMDFSTRRSIAKAALESGAEWTPRDFADLPASARAPRH